MLLAYYSAVISTSATPTVAAPHHPMKDKLYPLMFSNPLQILASSPSYPYAEPGILQGTNLDDFWAQTSLQGFNCVFV